MKRDELAEIAAASRGLLYPSESDEPLEPVRYRVGPDLEIPKIAVGRNVTQQSPDDFFAALSGTDDADRWDELRRLMQRCLNDIRVYRIGNRRVDVYVIGRARDGTWVGFRTTSVET